MERLRQGNAHYNVYWLLSVVNEQTQRARVQSYFYFLLSEQGFDRRDEK